MVELEEYLCPLSECQISLIKKILDARLSYTEMCEMVDFMLNLKNFTQEKYDEYSKKVKKGGLL